MSYDVNFRVKVEGVDLYVDITDYGANITWNVRELIAKSSGWEIKNEDCNGKVADWAKLIQRGIHELMFHSEKYRKYESPNGWGTVEGTLGFYRDCMKMMEELDPRLLAVAEVYVS